jgi:hypothetical protein
MSDLYNSGLPDQDWASVPSLHSFPFSSAAKARRGRIVAVITFTAKTSFTVHMVLKNVFLRCSSDRRGTPGSPYPSPT